MDPLRLDPGEKPPFTFCESVTASSASPWHIRKTTDIGPKFGGGIDTPSLCERVRAGHGWDLEVRITEHHLSHACPKCVEEYRKVQSGEVIHMTVEVKK